MLTQKCIHIEYVIVFLQHIHVYWDVEHILYTAFCPLLVGGTWKVQFTCHFLCKTKRAVPYWWLYRIPCPWLEKNGMKMAKDSFPSDVGSGAQNLIIGKRETSLIGSPIVWLLPKMLQMSYKPHKGLYDCYDWNKIEKFTSRALTQLKDSVPQC